MVNKTYGLTNFLSLKNSFCRIGYFFFHFWHLFNQIFFSIVLLFKPSNDLKKCFKSSLIFISIFRPLFLLSSNLSISTTIFFASLAKFLGTPPVTLVSSLEPKVNIRSEF